MNTILTSYKNHIKKLLRNKVYIYIYMRNIRYLQLNATSVGGKVVKICESLLISERLYAHIRMY